MWRQLGSRCRSEPGLRGGLTSQPEPLGCGGPVVWGWTCVPTVALLAAVPQEGGCPRASPGHPSPSFPPLLPVLHPPRPQPIELSTWGHQGILGGP